MNKIEVEGKLDRSWVVELMANGYNTYDIATNYELTEDTILECSDLLDKNILLQGLNFSEEFITKAIEIEYLDISEFIQEESFQDQNFEGMVANATRAAYDRARELSNELGDAQ